MVSGAELRRSGSDARVQKSAMAWTGKAEHSGSAHCDDTKPEDPRAEVFMGLFLPHKALLSRMEGPLDDQYY
jgi:hypothetical protein